MIDWVRVEELREEAGNDGFAEIVELFLDEVEDTIGRLRARPDPGKFEADLHFLKGCAWNMGFVRFGAICNAGERLARVAMSEVDLEAVFQGYAESRAAFIAGLRAIAAGRQPDAA